MSAMGDLLRKAEASMVPKAVPQAVKKIVAKVHPAIERRNQAFAQTPEARMARTLTQIQEQRRLERKEAAAKQERELSEYKDFQAERAEYLQLQRRWQLGGMTVAQFARLQELKPRHEGSENK